MASSLHLLRLLSLLSLFSFIFSSTTVTIPINPVTKTNIQATSNPKNIPFLVGQSQAKAHHLKTPKVSHLTPIPVSPVSIGLYTIPLSFGTPPQTLSFVLSTGTNLVWFPCTDKYQCINCTRDSNTKIPTFIPKQSSSSKYIGFNNSKCSWIHNSLRSNSSRNSGNSSTCRRCPPYKMNYASGMTRGNFLSETLSISQEHIPSFGVGCSLYSVAALFAVAGFGRGPSSLPSQLSLNKFSYILPPHQHDASYILPHHTVKSGSLTLESGPTTGEYQNTNNVSYTPLLKNPLNNPFAYYVGLRKILVDRKQVKIPKSYLALRHDGNGGTVVELGSELTIMDSHILDLLEREFVKQTRYKKLVVPEAYSWFPPCFNVSGVRNIKMPQVVFVFKGGARLRIPMENNMGYGDLKRTVLCLFIAPADPKDNGTGPAVILGNYQMQNYYLEFDLKNERFGFKKV